MKPTKALFLFLVALALTACSSDPQWADEEAHENTEQLRKQYTPIIAGTWHVEYVKDKGRFFERLTFSADGTFTGNDHLPSANALRESRTNEGRVLCLRLRTRPNTPSVSRSR